MAKRKGGGFGILAFIAIFLGIVAAGAGFGAFHFYTLYDQLTVSTVPPPGETILSLHAEIDKAQASEKRMLDRWNKLAPWVLDTKFVDPKDFDANNGDEEIKQKVILPILENLEDAAPNRNEKYEAQAEFAKKLNLKITAIFPEQDRKYKVLALERDDLKKHYEEQLKIVARERDSANKKVMDLHTQIADLQKTLDEKHRLLGESESKAQADQVTSAQQLEIQKRLHQGMLDEHVRAVSRLKNALEEKTAEYERVITLKERRVAALDPDGAITNVADGLKLTYVNLGRRNRIQRGMKFTVFCYGPGGVYRPKGEIEVIEVLEELSKAAILSMASQKDPIVEGDLIANPLYSPTAVPTFVICGEMVHYSREDLKRLIEEGGGQVQDKVAPDTTYVVAGGDRAKYENDANYKEALQLGLKVMGEQELLDFLPSTSPSGSR